MKNLGIYVHVPFCVRRCPYCGFYSNACGYEGIGRIREYFDFLGRELDLRSREYSDTPYFVDSVYFGGGTPSLAEPELIKDMIGKIGECFPLSDDAEISMEANPGTLTRSTLTRYRDAGVNRLSMGLQSFDDDLLKTLGRIHTAEDFRKCFDDARSSGFDNISVDLMFGVPGQTRGIWASTVDELVSMHPEHISFYSLQIEEGTPFYEQYKMGDMIPVTDEEDRAMYHDAIRMLEENGYHQYEISNAALAGKECRHNLKYWTFCDYLGIGASASSFMDGVRRTNPGTSYEKFASSGFPDASLAENHENSLFDNAADYMITGLRLNKGVSESDFETRFGKTIWEIFPDAEADLAEFFDAGCIKKDAGRLFITERGIDISNKILSCFV